MQAWIRPPQATAPHCNRRTKKQRDEEQYHVQFDKNVKVGARMAHVPLKRKSAKSIVRTTLKKKRPTFLDDDLDIGLDFGNNPNDSVLLGLDSLMAANDLTNPLTSNDASRQWKQLVPFVPVA